MKTKLIFLILIIFSSCTLFRDRKNVVNSIPGNWNLKVINDLDTSNVKGKFELKKIDKDNYLRKFEFRGRGNTVTLKGNYTIYGIKSTTYLNLTDSTTNFYFNGEMTDFIYQTDKKTKQKSIKYLEFIDTVKKSNKVIKIQMTKTVANSI